MSNTPLFSRSLRTRYAWPRRALHGLQAGTRLVMSFVPPASLSSKWSASVARAIPHQWHGGSSAKSLALLRLNSLVARCLPLCVVVMLVVLSDALSLVLPRHWRGLVSGLLSGLVHYVPPHFEQVALAAGMFHSQGRTPYAFVTFGRCTPVHRHGALPTFPCVTPA